MKFGQKIPYYLILGVFRLLTLLPLRILFLVSEAITFLVYYVIGYRKKVVVNNLMKSFPLYSPEKIKHTARKYYRHLSVMMVENIYLRFVSEKNFKKKLIAEDLSLFESLYSQRRNIIVMLGHFGNWEFAAGLSKFLNYKGAAVYKELTNPMFDKIYFDIRTKLGVTPIEMKDTVRKIQSLHQQTEPFMLLMVADQAPVPNDKAEWITFLNQPTHVFLGSEKLAIKYDMPVIYISLIRIKKGSYRVKATLITEHPKLTKPMEITKKYFELLEESITDAPRYWLWSHRRWKHKPKNYTY